MAQLDARGHGRGRFFGVFAPYAPSTDGPPPVAWGSEEHVRELLGEHVRSLRFERASVVVDHFARPADLREYYKRNFGPTIAAYAGSVRRRRSGWPRSTATSSSSPSAGTAAGPTSSSTCWWCANGYGRGSA